MSEFEDAVTAGYAAAAQAVAEIVRKSREAAAVWDVPESGVIFLPGDKVAISGTSTADGTYEVTKGDSSDAVWVNPYMSRQFEMKRIDPDA